MSETQYKEVVGHEIGKKRQSTVRFEEETARRIQKLQEDNGVSFAEAVRRLTQKGLKISDIESRRDVR